MSDLALQLIAKAKRTKAKALDLGNCGLTELPDELFQLTDLEELNLCNSYWDYELQKWIKSKNKDRPNEINTINYRIDSLSKLSTLRLYGLEVSDISFLEKLTGLQTLYLSLNEISDISFLEKLKGLQILCLISNKISDISFLENLTGLETLSLSTNPISDISFLRKLTSLQRLYLSSNEISDISFLEKLTRLQSLDISKNNISDYSFLENLTALQSLNLRYNQIWDISVLAKLTRLQSLDLRFNRISDISFLEKLTELQTLDLSDNKISDPSFLKKLVSLKKLYLRSNKFSDVFFLEKLTNLQTLDLRFNKISNTSILGNLTGLQTLNLSSTQISDISFLKKLTGLQTLYLSSNQISDIKPILGLIERGVQAVLKWDTNSIVLEGNPLVSLPPETIKQGNKAILNWFKANKKALNELKLILIGDPQAGKTSILQMLIENKFAENQPQTDGINIESLVFKDLETFKNHPTLKEVTAHCWDFGGQETMNATHRFFMSKRCVYVLVLNARKDNQVAQQVKNWVSRITTTGGNSVIIVVVNQIDVNPGFGFENEQELKQEFPQIKYFLKTSCKTKQGFVELKKYLAELIPQAELFNTEIDERWFPVKEQLQKETAKEEFLNETRFRKICSENGIPKKEDQKELIYFLNDLGIVLHFDNANLAEYFVLDPYWLTYGIYQIITSKYVAENNGIININQLEYVINEEEATDKLKKYKVKNHRKISYSTNERRYLLDFLVEYKLAFKSHCGTKVIVPDVLSTTEPLETTQPIRESKEVIQFVYDYKNSLPKSILPNFMADTNSMLIKYWRTGCVLKRGTESALVSTYDNRITITVVGKHKQKRGFLAVLRSYLGLINDNQNQKPKREIPLPNVKNGFVNYDELLKRERRGERTYYYYHETEEAEFEISKLLEGVTHDDEMQRIRMVVKEEVKKQKQNFSTDDSSPITDIENLTQNAKKIFISYSHEDLQYREKLERQLKPLLRNKKIKEIWSDHQILPGEDWNAEIEANLKSANIIFLLISDDFFFSDYIEEVEMPIVIKRHRKELCAVLPILVRPSSHWEDSKWKSIQAIPCEKGRLKAISKWADKDDAWIAVTNAIKEIL